MGSICYVPLLVEACNKDYHYCYCYYYRRRRLRYYYRCLPSPLIENDLEKGRKDLKHLTCQVPFYVVLEVNFDKISKFRKSGK